MDLSTLVSVLQRPNIIIGTFSIHFCYGGVGGGVFVLGEGYLQALFVEWAANGWLCCLFVEIGSLIDLKLEDKP